MPPRKSAAKTTTKESADRNRDGAGFSAEERAAMRERARELKAERSGKAGAGDEQAVLERIAAMPQPDRGLAERVNAIVRAAAPELVPRTWYGMPAWALDGKVVCFVQDAAKFKARYATLGFSDRAALDDGAMWPTSFALAEMNATVEARIAELVRRALRAR